MRELEAFARVTFWCELSEDEGAADSDFDRILEGIEEAVNAVPGVLAGSVAIPDADTVAP